jgi:hypothetical protein
MPLKSCDICNYVMAYLPHAPPPPHPHTPQDLPKGESACWALLPGLQQLQQSAAGYTLVAAAEAAAAGAAGAATVTAGIEGLGLAGAQQVRVCMCVFIGGGVRGGGVVLQ